MTERRTETPDRDPWPRRVLAYSVVRIVLAVFVTAIAGGMTQAMLSSIADGRLGAAWPELGGALAAVGAYALYVRFIEHRPATELSGRRAVPELGVGLLVGSLMVGTIVAVLLLLGMYHLDAVNAPTAETGVGFAQMTFVGVFEELLSRAIVFRLVERSLGSGAALAISSLGFGLAHVPGDSAGALSVAIAVLAGAFFGAAYLVTRRLWFCIGVHVGWNFTLGYVFEIAVSGHPSNGFVAGRLSGPSWVTGGAYGLEASVFTLFLLVVVGGWLLRRAVSKGHWLAWRLGARSSIARVASHPV